MNFLSLGWRNWIEHLPCVRKVKYWNPDGDRCKWLKQLVSVPCRTLGDDITNDVLCQVYLARYMYSVGGKHRGSKTRFSQIAANHNF